MFKDFSFPTENNTKNETNYTFGGGEIISSNGFEMC